MAQSRFCRVCKDFHPLEEAWPVDCIGHFGVAASTGPHIISDSMAPIRSMADGRMYDSKSLYRADLRQRGLVEVGNERAERRVTEAPPVRTALRQTMNQLRG